MVAGNQARMPGSILEGVRTMTANIVIEMGYAEGLQQRSADCDRRGAFRIYSDHQPGIFHCEDAWRKELGHGSFR